MANLQSPLVALEANPDTATYIGTLERAVAMLVIRGCEVCSGQLELLQMRLGTTLQLTEWTTINW